MAIAKYEIVITFDKACNNCAIGPRQVGYHGCCGKKDNFIFNKKQIIIEAERHSVYKDGTILSNNRNSLAEQIIKSLYVYYALSNCFPTIRSIIITHKRKYLGDVVYTEGKILTQPIIACSSAIPRKYQLSSSNIGELLNDDQKGNALRISTSYWLKAISSNDIYFKFDRLWRSFDRLMLFHASTNKETKAISNMKLLLRNNASVFSGSIANVITITQIELESFSWYKFLLSKSSILHSIILEYKDKRIVKLFNSILQSKSFSARTQNNQIQTHFTSNSTTDNKIDIVVLLAITYTYYVRCKMFHGEIPDSTFKISRNNEDWEIEKLVTLLEMLVYELLENNNLI